MDGDPLMTRRESQGTIGVSSSLLGTSVGNSQNIHELQ